ncbi:MAG TPA: thiol-activated cytolysin family protein [Burkholderiaceae bacterium]|nr:thiol-activated cytolysin family protein [Burkholderiaceae bacterium]
MNATRLVRLAALASSAVLMASCGGSDDSVVAPTPQQTTPIPTPTPTPESVSTYLQALPKWEDFSPPVPPVPGTKVADPTTAPELVDVPIKDAAGTIIGYRPEQYTCTTTRYSITTTPEKIVMFSPDRELVWPGALIQGRSHRDGLGSLLPLTVAQRAPIKVSIPSLATSDNYRTIETPDQAEVNQAIGAMVGNATTASLVAPSSIQFTMSDYSTDQSFALNTGLSGKYLGFSASASASYDTKANERTVMVYFLEKMFEVVVEPPQSPGAFFSADFTREKLDEQIALGRIGSSNLPVYVSNVVYGRIMAFTFTSTASQTDVNAALNAAYKGMFEAKFNLDVKYQKILQEGKITVTSLGGTSTATVAMIASGDWRQYFTQEAPLTSAYPISYTFRNLGDGSLAKVSESTEYNMRECTSQNTAGFMLDSFEAGPVNWTTGNATTLPVELLWGNPSTPQSIFYGYAWAKHLNYVTSSFFDYDIGYVVSPGFLDDQSDYYRGELSFWFKPDENMYTDGAAQLHCYYRTIWILFVPIQQKVCYWFENPLKGVEELGPTTHKVLVEDGYTTADHIVMRGGGLLANEVLTLTYNPKEQELPMRWSRHAVKLSNVDSAGKLLCTATDTKGCWLVEDRIATEVEIQYVLKRVTDLRIRASYPVLGVRRVCTIEPAPGAACPSYVDASEPIHLGYAGGYFDEIKVTKPPFGSN